MRIPSVAKLGASATAICSAVDASWIKSGASDQLVTHIASLCDGNVYGTSTCLMILFAVSHSGITHVRHQLVQICGERFVRVCFAFVSLCLAYSLLDYYIDHIWVDEIFALSTEYHVFARALNFLSFYFLHPKVFDLIEVAAIRVPRRSYSSKGITRITRHPQLTAVTLWSAGHILLVNTLFNVWTLSLVMAYHVFASHRYDRYYSSCGSFRAYINETSTVPFKAIFERRQCWPKISEFDLLPYACLTVLSLCASYVDRKLL